MNTTVVTPLFLTPLFITPLFVTPLFNTTVCFLFSTVYALSSQYHPIGTIDRQFSTLLLIAKCFYP